MVGYPYGRWSVVFKVGAIGGRLAFQSVVGCFVRQWSVVGVPSSIWSVVSGTRSVVCGWSVSGGFVLRLNIEGTKI